MADYTDVELLDSYPNEVERSEYPCITAQQPDWGDYPSIQRVRVGDRLFSVGDNVQVEYVVRAGDTEQRFDICFVGTIHCIARIHGVPTVSVCRRFQARYPVEVTHNIYYTAKTRYLSPPDTVRSVTVEE